MDRRSFLKWSGLATGAAMVEPGHASERPPPARVVAPGGQVAVITPNGVTLPMKTSGKVKVGHLIAGEFEHEFAPGMRALVWGYNGRTPGPTIEVTEGDRVRLYVTNRLPEPTTIHWHGIIVPNGMDGVAGLNQRPIPPGETYVYEFTLRHPGTFMYHPHFDEMTQMALGMMGMFIVHPKVPVGPRVDRDFALMTHEWRLDVGARRPDPNEMTDFNVLTFNSKSFPATEPLLVGKGERVRIRLGNLSAMDHHPIHLHGLSFKLTATDGGYVPPSAQIPETTVLVPVACTRVIEFIPDEPGDWAMHCHMTHHTMTQMGHGTPNMVGADTRKLDHRMSRVMPDFMTMGTQGMGGMGEMEMTMPPNSLPMRGGPGPFSYIDMGGMFTILKVRDNPDRADPHGWYVHPAGTVAGPANPQQMTADGIDLSDGKPER
ncbi:copper oxidase [Stigmatella aurantiaca]|uniref:Multicopper oxidase domain protein n=1 Tax=Stigmatella aurantiaca (strain DW4/3-1) TaxID=378806 RepID=Q090Q5_STIAD|nr:copper oxidase [Stigmatella aurantiaca]ADO74624.1 Multicopper oxidase domain protein [Stigmatella aurantiaca DW4/3-1]EAU66216.1 multicopper oxidase, type 3 [Stigmatella aurantiaca DW4/3-1]